MNLRWVVLFAAVATEGSFTRAATKLNLAQPWLSAQIRKLELELGISLFLRLNSGIELTPEGEALLPFALQISEAGGKFRDLARKIGAQQLRVVRIGSHVSAYALPLFLQLNDTFAARFPQFSITIGRDPTPELLSQVRGGQIDIAAVLAPFDNDELECLSIERVRPYILAPRGKKAGSKPLELAGRQVAVPQEELQPELLRPLFAALIGQGATIRAAPEADGDAMRQLSRTHGTPTLMIEGNMEDYTDSADLEALAIDHPDVEHVLVRLKRADHGRAAIQYWETAKMVVARPNL
jgi:DNA-binding transcriptional LysR family regulator